MNTEILITAIVSYFVIVDPVGVALIFQSLTEGKGQPYRRKMAFRTVLISLSVVLFFGFLGNPLLIRLGITMASFRIAGGLLLFYSAFRMVTISDTVADETDYAKSADISVFPLSFPLLAGPGCLALTILLFSQHRHNTFELTSLVLAVILIHGFTLVCLLYAHTLNRFFGQTASSVFKRLLGILLASLAIQFIGVGIKEMML